MRLSPRQQAILCGALAARNHWASQPQIGEYGYAREKRLIRDAKDGYARCDAAEWLGVGTLSDSLRVMVSRYYRQLEAKGLVERHDLLDSGRTSHLRITPAGEALAQQLLAASATT